jgi:hypothetical protein
MPLAVVAMLPWPSHIYLKALLFKQAKAKQSGFLSKQLGYP